MIQLFFELIKISILSSIYATLILVIFKIIAQFKLKDHWLNEILKRKVMFWLTSGALISFGLFIFMFTHYGEHGFGDYARIPVSYFKAVNQIDGNSVYLESKKCGQISLDSFVFDNDNLYAKTGSGLNNKRGEFVVWNLKKDQCEFFKTKADYLLAVKKYNYPLPESFKEFESLYDQYWKGWRIWMLP